MRCSVGAHSSSRGMTGYPTIPHASAELPSVAGMVENRSSEMSVGMLSPSSEAISLLGGSEWPRLRLAQQWHEFVHQGFYVVEPFCDFESLHRVLVEVLVQGTGCVEQAAYVSVSGLSPEPADGDEVVSVPAVFPAALFGDGLEDLGGGAPALLGCLREIAGGEFLSGLRQEMLAGLLILLGGHLGLLLLFLEVSNCGLPWQ